MIHMSQFWKRQNSVIQMLLYIFCMIVLIPKKSKEQVYLKSFYSVYTWLISDLSAGPPVRILPPGEGWWSLQGLSYGHGGSSNFYWHYHEIVSCLYLNFHELITCLDQPFHLIVICLDQHYHEIVSCRYKHYHKIVLCLYQHYYEIIFV